MACIISNQRIWRVLSNYAIILALYSCWIKRGLENPKILKYLTLKIYNFLTLYPNWMVHALLYSSHEALSINIPYVPFDLETYDKINWIYFSVNCQLWPGCNISWDNIYRWTPLRMGVQKIYITFWRNEAAEVP
jgi:hypothetical protein